MTSADQADVASALAILADCSSLSLATFLATPDGQGCHAASVFYAEDAQLNLYFLSAGSSLHAAHIALNPDVAVTINQQHADWTEIKGVQMHGDCRQLQEPERSTAIDLYLGKFTEVARFVEDPRTSSEQLIAERLMQSCWFRFSPHWV